MIPSAFASLVLALAAFRIWRLIGYDDFPPVVKARERVIGVDRERRGPNGDVEYAWRRPLLAHFLDCPWCSGFWVCLATYLAWRWESTWTVTAAAPFALSAAVGIVAEKLS